MNKILFNCSLLFLSALLVSCTSQPSISYDEDSTCSVGAIRFTTDFSTARMDKCELIAENEYLITLIPENTPINSSPWYAFKIEADQTTNITINMKVLGDKHRYPPKFSYDDKEWSLQDYKLIDDNLIMNITASRKPITIAAQEIIDNQYYIDWMEELSIDKAIHYDVLGLSTQDRSIYKIERKNETNKEWLVILGRQHPPEITGALALFPFVETLFSNSELSHRFLNKYNVLVIPNINPDGVHAGNWRHNSNGLDLNRDWKNFTQKETKQIHTYLQQLVAMGHKIKFAIDFHSTRKDIFYTMPTDYNVEQSFFVKHWLNALDRKMPDFDVIMKSGNNSNSGVSKQYFSDVYGVHAITYEMSDNTDRFKIKSIANNSANLLMSNMLSDIDHNKE